MPFKGSPGPRCARAGSRLGGPPKRRWSGRGGGWDLGGCARRSRGCDCLRPTPATGPSRRPRPGWRSSASVLLPPQRRRPCVVRMWRRSPVATRLRTPPRQGRTRCRGRAPVGSRGRAGWSSGPPAGAASRHGEVTPAGAPIRVNLAAPSLPLGPRSRWTSHLCRPRRRGGPAAPAPAEVGRPGLPSTTTTAATDDRADRGGIAARLSHTGGRAPHPALYRKTGGEYQASGAQGDTRGQRSEDTESDFVVEDETEIS